MSARADHEKRKQNGNHSEDRFFDSELAAKTFKRKDAGHSDANDYGAGERRLSVCAADHRSAVYQAMEKRRSGSRVFAAAVTAGGQPVSEASGGTHPPL